MTTGSDRKRKGQTCVTVPGTRFSCQIMSADGLMRKEKDDACKLFGLLISRERKGQETEKS